MEANLSPEVGTNGKRGQKGLLLFVLVSAHLIFYFAPNLYLPFDLSELFILGYVLVIADSGLAMFFGIKLMNRLRHDSQLKRRS